MTKYVTIKPKPKFLNIDAMPQAQLDDYIDSGAPVQHINGSYFDMNKRYTCDEYYKYLRSVPGDMFDDMPILRVYAEQVSHITEFGVRFGVSTASFLSGKPKVMRCYDRDPVISLRILKSIAQEVGTDFKFIQADVRHVKIEPTDLLFIDTLHTYKQLSLELELHARSVNEPGYIMFHDTVVCGEKGEDGSTPGLLQAITEFVERDPRWSADLISNRQSGLTVLRNFKSYFTLMPKNYKNYGG